METTVGWEIEGLDAYLTPQDTARQVFKDKLLLMGHEFTVAVKEHEWADAVRGADAVREMGYDADLDGPLVDGVAKGNKVEYLGTEDVDGTDAHKLKVTRPGGDVEYVYLDPDYFLEIRRVSQHRVRGHWSRPRPTTAPTSW
jgi:hypothetical protein